MSDSPIPLEISTTMLAVPVDHQLAVPSGPVHHSAASSNSWLAVPPRHHSAISSGSLSPLSECEKKSFVEITPEESVEQTLKNNGYTPLECVGTTLQGSVWKVQKNRGRGLLGKLKCKDTCIIKVASKELHSKGIARVDGRDIPVQENIKQEAAIMKYLSQKNGHKHVAKFERFFSDAENYFLAMEDGGTGMFEFVCQCHTLINEGVLSMSDWHDFCKIAMQQMTSALEWMHKTMNCYHLDVSLENFVIDNVKYTTNERTQKISFGSDFVVKIIDFGVSEVIKDEDVKNCKKYVGKTLYKCPEIWTRKKTGFDASAADVWSLAVSFWMMITGVPPFERPSRHDEAFKYIWGGKFIELLQAWNRVHYVTAEIVHLWHMLFRKEQHRISIEDIKNHVWFGNNQKH